MMDETFIYTRYGFSLSPYWDLLAKLKKRGDEEGHCRINTKPREINEAKENIPQNEF